MAAEASWLCYYGGLQLGEVFKEVLIDKLSVVITLVLAFRFLHEELTINLLSGVCGLALEH